MTAINGLIQLTLQEKNLSEPLRDNLEKIRTTGDYLMTLIDEVLETSQINAGKVVSISSAVHERLAVENVSTIIAERAKDAGIEFELIVHACEDRYVMMDLEHMERILMNLLSNALKFTPEGGKVTLKVDVSYTDKQVDHTYTIMDNGIGISPEFQQRMFLPFEQEKQTGGGLSEGTGLGLYICRNLVDLLGGTIDYSSKPGEGATFIVHMRYDLATDDQIQREKNKTATFEEQVLHGKTVLLVEDNNINAEVIMKILETKGMHSELARDGQEAIDIFKKKGSFYYQAILMDIMMPVKGGIEAAREIRSLNTADAEIIPIIALTADVYNDSLDQCLRAGMNAVLTKPIDIEKLGQTLAKEFVRIENESLA
jgi:two-component system CheB/CheR fusion protein